MAQQLTEKQTATLGSAQAPTTAEALDATHEGARGQSSELVGTLPEGGGEGIRRMFTWSGEVEVRPGVTETVYLGKYYWQGLPATRLDEYERHAQTPNGWFRITQTQYEIQHGAVNSQGEETRHPNPDAWTTRIGGTGGVALVKSPIEFQNEHRTAPDGGGDFVLTNQTDCDIEVTLDPAPVGDAQAVLEALDLQGNIRVLDTLHYTAGQASAQGHYTLKPGEALRVTIHGGAEEQSTTLHGITRIKTSGGAPTAPDTLPLYGTEVPQAEDLDAIKDLLR